MLRATHDLRAQASRSWPNATDKHTHAAGRPETGLAYYTAFSMYCVVGQAKAILGPLLTGAEVSSSKSYS